MKILFVSSFFPPDKTEGTEKRTLGYAESLKGLGHEIQVVCAGGWEDGGRYWNGFTDGHYRGIPVRRVHLNWKLAPDPNRFLYRNPVIEAALAGWLEEWQPDVVHVTSCYTLSASVIQAAKSHGLPVILTLTDFWFICPRLSLLRGDGTLCDGRTTSWECLECMLWDSGLYRRIRAAAPEAAAGAVMQWASKHPAINRRRGLLGLALDMDERKAYLAESLRAADRVLAPSGYLADLVQASGVPARVQVLHSGHDLSWLEGMPARRASSRIRFGYIGQISPNKGVHVLVSAFSKDSLAKKACLSIYGDPGKNPGYVQQLEQLAAGAEGAVKFHGAFSYERLGQVLSEIDVLVVPSTWHENNPRVIQEAFASRTPVIASDVGGISEFVRHQVNGLLFERGSAEDLARQMRCVVQDPQLLDRLRAAIPAVKTMGEEARELELIYRELANV